MSMLSLPVPAKEYSSTSGTLAIVNVFSQRMTKTDLVKEIIYNASCMDGRNLIESSCRKMVDCSSHTKEART